MGVPKDSLYEGGTMFGQTGLYFRSRAETGLYLSKPPGKGLNMSVKGNVRV